MLLGNALSPDDRLKYVRTNLVPGRILHLHCDFTTPPKSKFVVPVSIQPALMIFVVNSHINSWLQARADLRDRQVTLQQRNHSYLEHDSFLNCTETIRQMDLEEIECQLLEDMSNIKDTLTADERQAVLYAVKGCRTLSKNEINWITDALSGA
jgi:hypothetical protein